MRSLAPHPLKWGQAIQAVMADAFQIATLAVTAVLALGVVVLLLRGRSQNDDRTEMAVMERMMQFERAIRTDMQDTQKEVAASRDRLFEAFSAFQKATTESMHGTRKEVGESKDKMQESLKEFHKQMAEVNKTITDLNRNQEGASKLAEDLKVLMAAPKLRGNYGEVALEEMLARVLPEGMWERQVRIEGAEAVDAVVRYRDMMYPIDAKFPREHYERYLEADEGSAKQALWKEFETAIKRQIDSIAQKYIKPEKGTAEFALMFIPSEAVYYETIAERNGLGSPNTLLEHAYAKQVIPVSPNTFFAFLQIILVGARNLELVRSAKQLQDALADVRLSFDRFFSKYDDIGKKLEQAHKAYGVSEDHGRRLRERVDKVLQLELEPGEEEPVPKQAALLAD